MKRRPPLTKDAAHLQRTRVLMDPSLEILQTLFQNHPVVAVDTEFSRETPAHLAYPSVF